MVIVLLFLIGEPTNVEGPDIFRIEPDRLIVVADGTIVLLLRVVSPATRGKGIGEARVETDRLIVIGNGALIVAFGFVGVATVVYANAYLGSSRIASS